MKIYFAFKSIEIVNSEIDYFGKQLNGNMIDEGSTGEKLIEPFLLCVGGSMNNGKSMEEVMFLLL